MNKFYKFTTKADKITNKFYEFISKVDIIYQIINIILWFIYIIKWILDFLKIKFFRIFIFGLHNLVVFFNFPSLRGSAEAIHIITVNIS